MCGRYAFFLPPDELKKKLGLDNLLNIAPRYNCAPLQELPVVIKGRAGFARWGFRPEWSKHDDASAAARMINARSESAFEKPAFRESWVKARRCLVPANGFYEWAMDEHTGVKQPYYIQHQKSDMLYLAGLWSRVDTQVSFTILTKSADSNLSHLHHRSPVMIEADHAKAWFEVDAKGALDLIQCSNTRGLHFHKVGLDVGKVANDHEALIHEARIDDILKQSGRLL